MRQAEFLSIFWCVLEIGLTHPQHGDLGRSRDLIEAEYRLGNGLRRSDVAIQCTFLELASEMAAHLLEELESEITGSVGKGTQLQMTLQ